MDLLGLNSFSVANILQNAIVSNNRPLVQTIFEFRRLIDIGINARDSKGYSTFYHACNSTIEIFTLFARDHSLMVNDSIRTRERMVCKSQDVDDSYGMCPLFYLIKNSMYEKVEILLAREDLDYNLCDENGINLFMRLCFEKNEGAVVQLLKRKNFKSLLDDKNGKAVYSPVILYGGEAYEKLVEHWMATIKMIIYVFEKYKLPTIDLQLKQDSSSAIRICIHCDETASALYLIESPNIVIDEDEWCAIFNLADEKDEISVIRALVNVPYLNLEGKEYRIHEMGHDATLQELMASRYHSKITFSLDENVTCPLLEDYKRSPEDVHLKLRAMLGYAYEDAHKK